MKTLTENGLTAAALARLAKAPNPRMKQIMTSLIRHLHGFVRETGLTPAEWKTGIEFLTAVGHITDDKRQEFILLSDTLGVSAMVDLVRHRRLGHGTDSSLLGPFYRNGAPEQPLGASIAGNTPGETIVLRGRVDGRSRAAACRRAAGRMAGRAQRQVRHPGRAPDRDEPARQVSHRRGRALRVPLGQTEKLSRAGRRTGGRAASRARAPSVPSSAYPLHNHRRGLRATDYRIVYCRRCLYRIGRGIRRQTIADVGYHKSRAANGKGERAPDAIEFDFTLAAAAAAERLFAAAAMRSARRGATRTNEYSNTRKGQSDGRSFHL